MLNEITSSYNPVSTEKIKKSQLSNPNKVDNTNLVQNSVSFKGLSDNPYGRALVKPNQVSFGNNIERSYALRPETPLEKDIPQIKQWGEIVVRFVLY